VATRKKQKRPKLRPAHRPLLLTRELADQIAKIVEMGAYYTTACRLGRYTSRHVEAVASMGEAGFATGKLSARTRTCLSTLSPRERGSGSCPCARRAERFHQATVGVVARGDRGATTDPMIQVGPSAARSAVPSPREERSYRESFCYPGVTPKEVETCKSARPEGFEPPTLRSEV
jgi:hypothetical protein